MKIYHLLSFQKQKEAKKLDKELQKAAKQVLRQCGGVQIIMLEDNPVQLLLELMKAETTTTVLKWNYKKATMTQHPKETYQQLQLTFKMKQGNVELSLKAMKFLLSRLLSLGLKKRK
jgi:hypothetical protein